MHECRIRVRYAETDQMGFAWHGNYVAWLEVGRTEFMRAHGVSYRELERRGYALAVADVELRFLRPAFYDDELVVRTRLLAGSAVQLRFAYQVLRDGEDGPELLCEGSTRLACLGPDRRPKRLPSPFCERILTLVEDGD